MDLDTPPPGATAPRPKLAIRIAVLAGFVAVVAAIFMSGAADNLSLDALAARRDQLKALVAENFALAAVLYMAVYITGVACSVPGAVWLTIAGGFAFGPVTGAVFSVTAATIGAGILFVLARYVFGDVVAARAGPTLSAMRAGFQRNAFTYLLVLRLVPLFPFVFVNLVPALLGVSLRIFMAATFIGIIPGTFVFSVVGAGFSDVLAKGGEINPAAVMLQPTVLGSLIGLSILVSIPMIYRRIKGRADA